jgi:hypothetical protein
MVPWVPRSERWHPKIVDTNESNNFEIRYQILWEELGALVAVEQCSHQRSIARPRPHDHILSYALTTGATDISARQRE